MIGQQKNSFKLLCGKTKDSSRAVKDLQIWYTKYSKNRCDTPNKLFIQNYVDFKNFFKSIGKKLALKHSDKVLYPPYNTNQKIEREI